MAQQLDELLRRCTVKVTIPESGGWGTGFFVAPGLILTCAHVVREVGKPVQIQWQEQRIEAVVERSLRDPYDLALLRVTLPIDTNPPCVFLDAEIRSRDPLYLFGYPDQDFPNGCPVTFSCEGLTGDEPPLIKFALGQVRPGMSGSPLLNQQTGKVCGIVKFTRDRSIDLGGGAIPASVILGQFPELRELQREFHESDRRWSDLVANQPDFSWQNVCCHMLEQQQRLTSNKLFHRDEESRFDREQIFVPLALVEQKKTKKWKKWKKKDKEDLFSAEIGSKLYEPLYEEKQRFEHNEFLQGALKQGAGETKGQRIALIGAPGSGKTTVLQEIAFWVLEQDLGLPIWISLADLAQTGTLKDLWSYLKETWLTKAVSTSSEREMTQVQQDLIQKINQRRVWLLLDGVDEIAASGATTLQAIAQSLQGWIGRVGVVLTCRLNVWEGEVNPLENFEIYRLLDFTYPQQVHQFIDSWFVKDQEAGNCLKTELDKTERTRIRDLAKNPLRLALLCGTWHREGQLPETKAELYARLVKQFNAWKSDRFDVSRQEELALELGKLALQDIDAEDGGRFRLRESTICKKLGHPDQQGTLFHLALQLGWLNRIGESAESPSEHIYAFFHATFEEYFAAYAILDWDFFLPRKHKRKPVPGERYRIFEPQWREVILLWLGREDIDKKLKEEFIFTLTEFKDGCNHFVWSKIIGKGFYAYQAYYLAAVGIAEFRNCTQADKIVAKIVEWHCNPLVYGSNSLITLQETDQRKAIDALCKLLHSWDNETYREPIFRDGSCNTLPELIATLLELFHFRHFVYSFQQAAKALGQIGAGNQQVIDELSRLLRSAQDEEIRLEIAKALGQVSRDNQQAIDTLIALLHSGALSEEGLLAVVKSLEQIGTGKQQAIDALTKLLGSRYYPRDYRNISVEIAESLEQIEPGNKQAIDMLIEILTQTRYCDYWEWPEDIRWKAMRALRQIGTGNQQAIDALIELLHRDEDICLEAVKALGRIGTGNQQTIDALIVLLASEQNKDIRLATVNSLGQIATGNQQAIDVLTELLHSAKSKLLRWAIADALGQISADKKQAIDALIALLHSAESEWSRWAIANSLGQTDVGNQQAICTLIELLHADENENFHLRVLESLGRIGTGDKQAIDALLSLLHSEQSERIRFQIVTSLGEISTGDKQAIDVLTELICSERDGIIRQQAIEILGKISRNSDRRTIVTALRSSLSPLSALLFASRRSPYARDLNIFFLPHLIFFFKDFFHEDFKFYRYAEEERYELIWDFAQTMTYPDFHQAWHQRRTTPRQKKYPWTKKTIWQFVLLCFLVLLAIKLRVVIVIGLFGLLIYFLVELLLAFWLLAKLSHLYIHPLRKHIGNFSLRCLLIGFTVALLIHLI